MVLIGSPNNNSSQGSAYLYVWDGTGWPEKKITASDGAAGNFFGYSVGLSRTAHFIVISAPGATIGTNVLQGAIYMY